MPLILLDVGKLVHKYCEYNLNLVTKCSVQLSVPETLATAASNLTQLQKLTYKDLWLARGDGLQICVELSLSESIVSCLDKPSLVEGLGQALRNAEIWPQLCLQASLTLLSAEDRPASSTADFIISLTYSHDSTKDLRYVPRAHPPEGIAQGGLRSVNVSFCVSEISTEKTQRKKRLRLPETKVRKLDDDHGLANGTRLCMSQPTLDTVQTLNTGLEEYRSASQPIHLSDEDVDDGLYNLERSTSSNLSVLFSPGEATYPSSNIAWVQNTYMKRRADDESLHAKLGMRQLVEITDVALRTLIYDNQKPNPAGIKCLSKSLGPKLSAIAPALFSPGYHNAVSQRSHFLPRIAHVFARMQRRPTSTTLRKKLNSIADLSAIVSISDDPAMKSLDPVCDISRQIEARLWSMLQRTLFDRKAARKLEPLTVAHRGFPFDPTLSEEMLEDPLVSGRETDPKSLPEVDDDEQSYSDSLNWDQDDLLLSDAAETVDEDLLIHDYQDGGYVTGRVTIGDAEPLYDTGHIERQIEFIASRSTQDLAGGQFLDSESCSFVMGHVCNRNVWQRDLEDSSKASSEFDFCICQARGSSHDEDEIMI